jgi:hypothetical protein
METYRKIYQQRYQKRNSLHIRELQLQRYYRLKNDLVNCLFCNKLVNLYYCKTHLKSKKCVMIQNILKDKNEYDDLNIKMQHRITELIDKIKYSEDDNVVSGSS